MFWSQGKLPQLYIREDGKLLTDRCIWCGAEAPGSRAHLFPRYLGGRFWALTNCTACNNALGSQVEEQAAQNPFLTAAIAKLGIAVKKKDAFRHARKVDIETGFEMQIDKDDIAKPKPQPLVDGGFLAAPNDAYKKWSKLYSRELPNWPLEPVKTFLEDPTSTSLDYGKRLRKRNFAGGPATIRLEGLTRDPDPGLVLKIAYEACVLSQLIHIPCIRELLDGAFTVECEDGKSTIKVNDRAASHIVYNLESYFRKVKCLDTIDFRRYHAISLGLTPDLILFLEVRFFGAVRTLVVFGKVDKLPDFALAILDRFFVFPLDDHSFCVEVVSHLAENQRFHVDWVNGAIRLHRLKQAE